MKISDPRWKPAADWLTNNRTYQNVVPRLPTPQNPQKNERNTPPQKKLGKAQHYLLENGWEIVVVWDEHHGNRIAQMHKDEKSWLANNGSKENGLGAEHYNKIFGHDEYIDLPEFAQSWLDPKSKLVKPNFEISK